MRGRWELSDAQWELIEPILRPKRRSDGRVVRGKIRGQYSTGSCGSGYRRAVAGTAKNIRRTKPATAASSVVREGNWKRSCVCSRSNCTRAGNWNWRRFIDASFTGQKRGPCGRAHKRGKGTKILAICTDHSLPLAVGIQSASPHESQLVEEVLGKASSTNSRTTDWRRRLR